MRPAGSGCVLLPHAGPRYRLEDALMAVACSSEIEPARTLCLRKAIVLICNISISQQLIRRGGTRLRAWRGLGDEQVAQRREDGARGEYQDPNRLGVSVSVDEAWSRRWESGKFWILCSRCCALLRPYRSGSRPFSVELTTTGCRARGRLRKIKRATPNRGAARLKAGGAEQH